MNTKQTKQRSCVGCKKKDDKFSFLRIVFDGNGLVIDDEKQSLEGRGCYLCKDEACFEKAVKRNAFNYRLKQKISRDEVERFGKELEDKIK